MAYGFNLGQIEGLDSSVKTVELTLEREGQTLSLTLAYSEGDGWWFEGTDNFVLMVDDTTALLWLVNATESNVGDVYNITLSTESIEPNFKAAVEEVANAVYETSTDVENAIMSALPSLFAGAIQNGKSNTTVTLPTGVETAIQIKKIAEDVVSGKNVTVKMSTGGYAIKPIVGVANNNNFEYTLLFYYTYNTYVFRVTIGFSFNQVQAHMFAELMASP